jgi:hypothetical protein
MNQRTKFIDRVGNSRQGVTEAHAAAKRMRFSLAAHGATVNMSYFTLCHLPTSIQD